MTQTPVELLWRSARRLGRNRAAAKSLPPLIFFTDRDRTPHAAAVLGAMPRGSGFVFRAFGADDAAVRGVALSRIARRRGVVFMVGADARLAVVLRADGIHLPERMIGRIGAIRALRGRFLLTAAVHGIPAALRARRAGVDAIVVSSVFPSRSQSARPPMGSLAFASLVGKIKTPAYALGGVNPRTALRLSRSGAIGLAVVDALAGGRAFED